MQLLRYTRYANSSLREQLAQKRRQRLIGSNMINIKKRSYRGQQKHDMNDKLDTLDKKMSIPKLVYSQREVFSHLLHHAYQAYHSYHALCC